MRNFFFALGTIVILVVTVSVLPINKINWGRFSIQQAGAITVTGTAQGQIANQIANFTATVLATNQDKTIAVNKVNQQMTDLVASLKNFGIPDADIQTENVSVYQLPQSPVPVPQMGVQTMMYPVPPIRTGNGGDWQASNSISITLRDVTKASSLTDLLNNSGATNVYGPNLSVDENSGIDSDLLAKAVANAKIKAQGIAKASGQTLGKIITLTEGGTTPYIMPLFQSKTVSSSGIAAPVEPGSTTMTKTVTVTWELN